MKKKILLAAAIISVFGFQFSNAQAQNNPVVMEVGGQQIRQTEFMQEFLPTVTARDGKLTVHGKQEKQQAIREYADLFATFRAKLLDAHERGFDTAAELRKELRKYRGELAAPYLIDSAVLKGLLEEAYERNHYSLHAAHILVRVREDALPEDTLEAFKLISSYRKRIDAGEDFMQLAAEEFRRVNPNTQMRPNEGDLGYFTAFDMVYPFENAAYNLKVGEVSQPVRTRYGYHLIKLIDRVNMHGKVTMAHIWLQSDDSSSNRKEIYEIYKRLQGGASFAAEARRSNDRTTAEKGGELPPARLSQLPPEYIHVLAELQNGQYSKPFFTHYGWHIVKLVHKDSLPPFRSMQPYYKQKMTVDPRGSESRKSFAAKARAKYGIEDLTVKPVPAPAKRGRKAAAPVVMQASLDEVVANINDSVFNGIWRMDDSRYTDERPIVRVPNREYKTIDLARYIRRHQKDQPRKELDFYVRQCFDKFLDSVTIAYADSQLETEHPDFADVVAEYRRGLMIFNYNDKMIWSKAIYDTLGFADFYFRESAKKSLSNPDDSVFFWKKRARVVVLTVADSAQLAPAKASKLLNKALKKEMGSREMKQLLEKNFSRKAAATPVEMEIDLVEYTHQQLLADDQWSQGVYLSPANKGYRALVVMQIVEPMLKAQGEARGYYLNAYQNEVEQKLNDQLRRQYDVKINWDVIDKITY